MNTINRKHHTIDVEGKILGRVATEVAILLRGKNKVTFEPHVDNGDFVAIKNIEKIAVSGNKIEQKIYRTHSGYPGGLKETQMKKMMAEKPEEILKLAVWNMLPKNKLRAQFIKRLTFLK